MGKHLFFAIIFALGFCAFESNAQDTYPQIYQLMQAKCASCHSGDVPAGQLDLSGSEQEVYNALVGTFPVNPSAANKGYQLVKPGYPRESFFYKKINAALDPDFQLTASEGGLMPVYQEAMTDPEIELVRQWIVHGAPIDGVVKGTNLIEDYYAAGPGIETEYLEPPAADEGFQIFYDPVFLAPGEEREFTQKFVLDVPETMEVTRIEAKIHEYSHHFVLYKYFPETAPNVTEGRKVSEGLLDVIDINTGATPLAVWMFSDDNALPPGTAYVWPSGTSLDLNYHIKNYSSTSILSASVYLNVYTQPAGTAEQEMLSGLATYGEFDPFILNIPNTGETALKYDWFGPSDFETTYFWKFQGHTHALGTDFDIYLRNPDGTEGEQIYEGFYDSYHQFDQGYFDYAHPPILRYDELLPIKNSDGLVMSAKWVNEGPEDVGFGLTTDDEMFVTYYQYTLGPTSYSTNAEDATASTLFEVYPTAYEGQTNIRYQLEQAAEVNLSVFDVTGKLVQEIANQPQEAGGYQYDFSAAASGHSTGMYIVKLSIDGMTDTRKIIEQ